MLGLLLVFVVLSFLGLSLYHTVYDWSEKKRSCKPNEIKIPKTLTELNTALDRYLIDTVQVCLPLRARNLTSLLH